MTIRLILRHTARAILLTVAVLYFLIDLIFLSVVRPLRRRLMALKWIRRLREWVSTLNRYAALLLLFVPWLILEPIKPIGFLLFARKHHLADLRSLPLWRAMLSWYRTVRTWVRHLRLVR